ncbi:MAG TPA: carboxypeptidase regulatory-like domain-containing protein [Solirubrobacteraceae bacterium]|nr:carboxypeptidase regulatory-like domain-containing protein [Solirubrobacteraceae bacterium]
MRVRFVAKDRRSPAIRRTAWVGVAAAATLILVLAMAGPAAAATATLSGRVTDGVGNPLGGSTIAVDTAGTTSQVAATTTSLDGSYSVSVEAGSYDVHVTPPAASGFNPAIFADFAISGATALDVVLTNAATVTFQGVLRTSRGEAIPGASVRLISGSTSYYVSTSSTGAFSLAVPPGSYELAVQSNGSAAGAPIPFYWFLYVPITITGDLTQNLTVPVAAVTAQVRDPSGSPVAGASIKSSSSYSPDNVALWPGGPTTTSYSVCGECAGGAATTDSTGNNTFDLPPNSTGNLTLTATPPENTQLRHATVSNLSITTDTTVAFLLQSVSVRVPTVTKVEPASGPAAGGTSVTITGTGFSGASAVKFGSANATSFTVNSATSITATSPTGSGTVDVTVTTPGGTSATSAADRFTYLDPTATTVECTPSSLLAEAPSTCRATVSDTASSGQSTPSGTVSFSSSGSGSFSGGASCTLSQTTTGVAACSLIYTPSGTPATPVRTDTMTAIYGGDPLHTESNGSTSMEVITPHPSATAVECTPGSLLAGSQSTCKATVSDTASSGQSTSTGTVSFTTSGSGSFSGGASCTLSESAAGVASCTVTYTPNASPATQVRSDTVTVAYAGDPLHNGSNGSTSVQVTTQHASVSALECAPSSLEAGSQSTTCKATVTDSAAVAHSTPTGAVNFRTSGSGSFAGSTSCTLSESAAGVASCTVTYTPNASPATQVRSDTLTAAYSGDALHTESNGATTVEVITPHSSATTVQCVPSSLVAEGQSTCTATVVDSATSSLSPPTGTVRFSSSGSGSFSISGKCVLSQSGLAVGEASCSLTYTPSATPATQVRHDNIMAIYGGDALHNESSGATIAEVITPHPTATVLECTPSSVVAGSQSTCKVTVSDAAGVAQSTPTGKVSFSSSGSGSFSGSARCTLGESSGGVGSCSVTYTPGGTPATQVRSDTITATYGGDTLHTESSRAGSVQVLTPHPSAITVACSPSTYVVAGRQTTCTATVTDTAGVAKSMPTGTISLSSSGSGSFSGASKCTLTESSSGVAACSLTYTPTATPATPVRSDIITAAYGGDSLHTPSSGTAAEQVLSITLLSSGSFVIGDQSAQVGTAVTFWGAQWWKLNSLSGGTAPSSFKGFANSTPNNPPHCGDRWTSATGNSSNPPSSVPGLMAVIASSSITESGETISGNAPKVLIVKTGSGYAPNPGHAGTGTIVAQVCP